MRKIKDMKKEGVYHFHASFKAIPVEEAKNIPMGEESIGTVVKGYASTPTLDRYNDVVVPEAFRASIQNNYRKNPMILFQHMSDRPIGKATFMSIDDKGLYIEALIVDSDIEPKIKAGILRTFSIGYIPKKIEFIDEDGNRLNPDDATDRQKINYDDSVKRIIKELELVENSIVSIPANPDALFSMEKSVKSYFEDLKKGAIKNISNNLIPKFMEKDNLLEKKEEETVEDTEKVEAVEETVEEKPEEVVETPADETDGEEDGGEKDSEEATEVETDEVAAEEVPEGQAVVEEEATEEEGEKSLADQIMTKEGAALAIEAIQTLNAKVKELETIIKENPTKKALAYFEGSVETPEGKKLDVKDDPKDDTPTDSDVVKKGFKAALESAAQ